MPTIEAFDEIQVFILGTGMPLWGRIQPNCRYARNHGEPGGIKLELTVEPRFDTVTYTRQLGVIYPDGMVAPLIGKRVHIPQRLVDVVFGDNRHEG